MITFVLILAILYGTNAVPLDTACKDAALAGNALFCGTDLTIEKLACEGGKCKGTYLNNKCSTAGQCASTYYCNTTLGVCDKCQEKCLTCTATDACTACITGYFYNTTSKVCEALGTNCANSGCTSCNAGFYPKDATCTSPCEASCATCSDADTCLTCPVGFYLESTCKAGISYCAYHTDSTHCLICAAGYYLSTGADTLNTCKQGLIPKCLTF